jgi:ubiquinone/menaquinone biosynthesis C-methylase UbiE
VLETEEKHEYIRLNEKKWDARAETFERKWFNRFNFFQFLQMRVIALLYLNKGQHFLDIGCGTRWAVRYAASVVQNKGDFYGIDISPKMIEKAKEICGSCENIHFDKANAEKLPFENDFFDFIICTNSFHHYFNPSRVLAEVFRVLKSHGRFLILDATTDGPLVKIIDRFIRKRDHTHVKMYSTREYRAFFTQAGLKHVSSKSIWGPMMSMKVHIAEK